MRDQSNDVSIGHPGPEVSESEVSLLDLVVAIAENWLWLVLVSLGAGVAAFLFIALQPAHYRASVLVSAPTSVVVDFLKQARDQAAAEEGVVIAPLVQASGALIVEAAAGRKASALSIISTTPEAARQHLSTANTLIQQAIRAGEIPSAEEFYAERVTGLESRIALRAIAIERLGAMLKTAPTMNEGQDFALSVMELAQLLNRQDAETDRLQELLWAGADFGADAVQDSVSVVRLGRSPLQIALLAAGGAGFLMLILIFIRKGLADAAKNPEARSKLDRIRNGLLLRKSKSSR